MIIREKNMKSLKYLYRIGHGPSSSHTMGPANAIRFIKKHYQDATSYSVVLYGSLAFTGRGHLTDKIIVDTASPIPCEVVFDYKSDVEFPNTLDITIHFADKEDVTKRILSLGGGAISISGEEPHDHKDVYQEKTMTEIVELCKKNNWKLCDYVYHYEGPEIKEYLKEVWSTMSKSIDRGLVSEGYLPGKLKVLRKAHKFLVAKHDNESMASYYNRILSAYAFAVSEENASGGIIVTAPTCGASGTLPSVIKYMAERCQSSLDDIVDALACAGVFGNIVKRNGSISGAEAGCQAEIGTATAMAAVAACSLRGLPINVMECAAEIAIEHSLGLTCDPVEGYVQIPCIERNGISAIKATSACYIAEFVADSQHISFDQIVKTALQTGKDINKAYRETAQGGLALSYKDKN